MSEQKVLVIGANGYAGARLYMDLSKEFEVYGSFHRTRLFPELIKLDVTKEREVCKIVQKTGPRIIVHVSAIPSIAKCKEDVGNAFRTNVEGTRAVVNAANKIDARIVYISSVSAQTPQEVYDITKSKAEEIVKTTKAGFLILRPGLLIGQSPNINNNRFHNLLLGDIVKRSGSVYDNRYRLQPAWLGHLSEVITSLAKKDEWNHLVPVIVNEHKTRFEIATDILQRFGVTCSMERNGGRITIDNTTQEKAIKLGLPIYSYSEVIDKVVEEIKLQLKK